MTPRIFFEQQEIRVKQISVHGDRLYILQSIDGAPRRWFWFTVSDLVLLIRAIERKDERPTQSVGSIDLKNGQQIEISSGDGAILLRRGWPDTRTRSRFVRLEGEEIRALTCAIASFKSTAARAAS